jgi:hypothetical protein
MPLKSRDMEISNEAKREIVAIVLITIAVFLILCHDWLCWKPWVDWVLMAVQIRN